MKVLTEDQTHDIKTAMYAKRITVQDLVDKLGRSRAHWSRLINGDVDGRGSDYVKLGKLLELTPTQFLKYFFNL
jgi:transcriptional regulator with XRE-family HTH domain